MLCKLDHDQWRTELRMVEEVATRTLEYTYAAFVVEDGRPGPRSTARREPPKLGRCRLRSCA